MRVEEQKLLITVHRTGQHDRTNDVDHHNSMGPWEI